MFGDGEAEAFEAVEFFGVVGEDAEFGKAEVAEDLGADAEVAAVHELAGGAGIVRAFEVVEALQEGAAAGFLAEVDDGALAGGLNEAKGGGERVAGIGGHGVKDVAEEIF